MMRRLLTLFLAAAATVAASAQTAPAAPTAPTAATTEASPFFSRLSGVFGNGDLPELDRPEAIKLTLRPHFGDLAHRDYLRVETGLRWALSDQFELTTAASVFYNHGVPDAAEYGIGLVRGGARYVFRDWPWRDYETSLDVGLSTPVGHPPADMIDGFRHFRPSFVVQHPSTWNPRLTLFAGAGLDLIKKTSLPGKPGVNQPRDNSVRFTTGGVYDAGQLKWTFTTIGVTTAGIGARTQNFLYVQPGVLWYVPRRLTFHSRAQWIVGLGADASWGPDGFDIGASARLRAEITFRQVMDTLRGSLKK